MKFTLSQEQINRTLEQFDLKTFKGWSEAAYQLLKDAPDWTAIVDAEQSGFIVKRTTNGNADVYACAKEPDGHTYSDEDLIDFDISAWGVDAWEGMTPKDCMALLQHPKFVQLNHSPD